MAASIRTLLVAIAEPRAEAQPVLERALSIAQRTGARVVLFHAAFEPALSSAHAFDAARIEGVRRDLLTLRLAELEKHAARVRTSGAKVEALCSWDEPPHEAIVRAALHVKASLVLAGPHAESGPRSVWRLRHTDWQLLRLCPMPLLLVRKPGRAEGGIILAALDPTHASDAKATFDKHLARSAQAVAEALQFDLHAVQCVVPIDAFLVGPPPGRRKLDADPSGLERVLRSARVRAADVHVVVGLPDTAIPATVERLGADILAIGTVSRRGLAQLVFGNTAERIIDAVAADLLVIKPAELRLPRMRTQLPRLHCRSQVPSRIRRRTAQ